MGMMVRGLDEELIFVTAVLITTHHIERRNFFQGEVLMYSTGIYSVVYFVRATNLVWFLRACVGLGRSSMND